MSDVKFDVLNARVTFKNVPLHSLSRFAFKDVAAEEKGGKKSESNHKDTTEPSKREPGRKDDLPEK
jgi:hypothetical protein